MNVFKLLFAYSFLYLNLMALSEENYINLKDKNNEEIFIFDGISRELNFWRARDLILSNSIDTETLKEYKKICKKYFGVNSDDDLIGSEKDKKKFEKEIIEIFPILNMTLSQSDKYKLDMSLKYIISKEKYVFKNMDKDTITKMASISFLISMIFPLKYSYAEEKFSPNNEKENEWNEIINLFKNKFFEIGSLKDHYLYDDFEKKLLKKLNKSNTYKEIKAGYRYTKKYLKKWHNNLNESLKENYKYIIRSFSKSSNESLDEYLNLTDIFIESIKKDYFNFSMNYMTNEDCLFMLMIIGRLSTTKNIKLLELPEKSEIILNKYGIISRLILDEICKICKINPISWNNLDIIKIKSEKIENILKDMALFGSLGSAFGIKLMEEFLEN